MSEEMKQQTEAVAAGMNRLPEGVRAQAVKLTEAYANGLAAGIALAAGNGKEDSREEADADSKGNR